MGTISRLKLYLISFAILVALIVIPLLGFLITLEDNSTGPKEAQSEDFKTIEKRIKEFTAHAGTFIMFRKFCNSACPCSEAIDSGWN